MMALTDDLSIGCSYLCLYRKRYRRRDHLSQVWTLTSYDDLWVAPLGRIQTRLVCRGREARFYPCNIASCWKKNQRFGVVKEYTIPPTHGCPLWGDSPLTVWTLTTRQTELSYVTQFHLWLANRVRRESFLLSSTLSRQLFHLRLLNRKLRL
jgi:hypothetical protein